jgi:uncharacterized protein YijF (DUF1287 family)
MPARGYGSFSSRPTCIASTHMDNPPRGNGSAVRHFHLAGRGEGAVKKNNRRRKASGLQKNGRHQRPPRMPAAAVALAPRRHGSELRTPARTSALLNIDWPAIAILTVPIVVMALLHSYRIYPPQHLARPVVWHGELSREAMPLQPDALTHTAIADVKPSPEPWHGDLAREAMPLQPDTSTRTAIADVKASPEPWHGDLAREAMPLQPDTSTRTTLASAEPPPEAWGGDIPIEAMPLQPDTSTRTPAPTVAALPPAQCMPDETSSTPTADPPEGFGHALAAAARSQTDEFVIYNARYVSLAYPGGDTQPLYGVCTDVVIRAYRALGIDLQELIHASRLGRGDPSIDHRRVEVVRRFLTRHGTSLAISEFAEDYRPGDIVTYHRPEGRISQFHIAIVSDRIAPSGRPLIIHNRGWGPQLEDALFVDQITGHYRLSPEQVEAFQRTRAPRVSDRRRRTAETATTTRR